MRKHERRAYRPRPPFKVIEGVGTAPFKRLDPFAQYTLLRFYENFNGFNRSDLSLTYSELRPIISNLIFSRSIWQLIGFGFLEVRRWGRLERNCTLFGLSDQWRRFCEPGSEKELNRIATTLKEIETLKRQKWEEGKKSEKRERISALRHSLVKVREPS